MSITRKEAIATFVADAHCDTLFQIAIKGVAPGKCVVTPQRLAAGGVGL